MIKSFMLLPLMVIITVKCYSAELSTPSVINEFYHSMELLSNETSATRAQDLQTRMQECFIYGKAGNNSVNSGIYIPNDFYILEHSGNERMNSTLYTMKLKERLFDDSNKRLKIKINDIKNSSYAQEVNLQKFQSEDNPYIRTIVTKTFSLGQTSVTFNDTVLTANNLIVAITNGVGHDDKSDNTESLRAMAAQYYSQGLYKKAFQIYERILAIDPHNANSYYRMGILAFWYGKSCGFKKSKEYHAKGREYMEKARLLGYYRANQVLYYMNHPSI